MAHLHYLVLPLALLQAGCISGPDEDTAEVESAIAVKFFETYRDRGRKRPSLSSILHFAGETVNSCTPPCTLTT